MLSRQEDPDVELLAGWRRKSTSISLEESNSTLPVPSPEAAWYRQWSAYIGVGFMVSVGYASFLYIYTLTCMQYADCMLSSE